MSRLRDAHIVPRLSGRGEAPTDARYPGGMDLYHIWFDLKPGVSDVAFSEDLSRFLERLRADERIASWRFTRRKLGFGPQHLGEFHAILEVTDLVQLEGAFRQLGTRAGEGEGLHAAVNQQVTNFQAALYRDFPDPFRKRGEEKF